MDHSANHVPAAFYAPCHSTVKSEGLIILLSNKFIVYQHSHIHTCIDESAMQYQKLPDV